MSNIIWNAGFDGTPDPGDVEAAMLGVTRANQNRETPLPTEPPASLKASYLTVQAELLAIEHANNLAAAADKQANEQQAWQRWKIANEAERTAALAQLPPLP